jgi:hypothetical protein
MGYEVILLLGHIVVILAFYSRRQRALMLVVSTAEVECGCFEQLADAANEGIIVVMLWGLL